MKIDFSKVPVDLDGIPFTEKDVPVKVSSIAINALLATFPHEQALSGEDKLKRFTLAQRIKTNEKSVDISAEELALIKSLIGYGFPPLCVGAAYAILDPKGE